MNVIEIKPTKTLIKANFAQGDFWGGKRVASYARVSTKLETQSSSLDHQKWAHKRLFDEHPEWIDAGLYIDWGKSGTTIEKRPGFMAMLEDARAGKIDLIRVKTVSRFSRNSLDTIKITQELKEIGVEVYFDGQGISNMDERSELAISVLAAISQGEIIDISDNVIWGLARSREKGKIILPFSIFLGYKKGEDGRIEIDKKEARVVRKIYEMFNNEMSMRKIAHYLGCRVKYKTPGGKDKWWATGVWRILTNEKYAGVALLQKTFVEDVLKHKVVKNNGQRDKVVVLNSHMAIISPEEFIKTQEKLAREGHRYNDFFEKYVN